MATKKQYTGRDSRQSGCRGLIIQIKGAGYNFEDRYQEMIKTYLKRRKRDSRPISSSEREERYLNLMKGENQYKAYDRSKQTDPADIRTMQSFLRTMGAIDDEDMVTRRGEEIVEGMNLLQFLQKYIVRVKVVSPQSKKKNIFKEGHRQASYGAYRLRIFLMILYAAMKAKEHSVRCEIDDIALTACRFWPLSEIDNLVTERMVINRIDSHFVEKERGSFDYKIAFENELRSAMEDSTCKALSDSEKARKFRNTADVVNNYFRLLKNINLIELIPIKLEDVRHWTLSTFSDHKTGTVPPRQIKLTETGIQVLGNTISKTPIWFLDIFFKFEKDSGKINKTLEIVNKVVKGQPIDQEWPEHSLRFLEDHGVLKKEDGKFIKIKDVDFDWVYDMHTTGHEVKKLFGG
ncbi:MAG: hypothetical protein OXH36_01765 [Bdellovibrionales bacterium]|nr:hypothetical protein [Bdellovibrionales bacterium]